MTEQGLVLEGTQTNFFAIEDDTLYTATDGVLMGTVRGVVLEVHKANARTMPGSLQTSRHTNLNVL